MMNRNKLNKAASLFAILLVMSLTLFSTMRFLPSAKADVYPSWIHTDGPLLRNSNHEQVLFQGAAIVNLGESGLSTWNCNISDVMYQYYNLFEGKANVIRVATGLDAANGNWSNVQVFYSALDQVIALAYQYQINIILEFHGGLNQSAFNYMMLNPSTTLGLWFTDLATRYLTNSTVIGFELYNEPNSDWTNQTAWRTFMNSIVAEIDAVNPNALQIVASVPFGSISTDYINNPMPYNVVYGFDVYYKNEDNYWKSDYDNSNWQAGYAKTYEKVHTYEINGAENLPKWETEFGYFNIYAPPYPLASNEAGWDRQMVDHIQILVDANVNYYIYDFSFGPENMGLNINNTLTTYGQNFLDILRATTTNWPNRDLTDWPIFMHDSQRSGVGSGSPALNGSSLWNFSFNDNFVFEFGNMEGIQASPVVVDGIVYVGTTRLLSGVNDGSPLVALNASTGEILWNYSFPFSYSIYSSVAVADGIAYVAYDGGFISALNASTGIQLWIYNATYLGNDTYATGSFLQTSPVVESGILYIGSRFGSSDGALLAINITDGAQIWNYTFNDRVVASPAIVDGVVYIGSENYTFAALNAATGAVVWAIDTGDLIESSASVANGIVYVATSTTGMVALNASNGITIWNNTDTILFGSIYAAPAVSNDRVFIGSDYGEFFALNASTGEQLWNFTKFPPDYPNWLNAFYGSASIVDDVVYVTDTYAGVFALNATDGSVIWNYAPNDSWLQSAPAVVDGVVFVGSEGNILYAIGSKNIVPSTPSTSLKPTLYFRSDTYTTLSNSGYGLDSDFTNTAQTISGITGTGTITYGFRVWLIHYGGSSTELTSGTPIGQLTRTSNGSGIQGTDWNFAGATTTLGYDALKVGIYSSTDGSTWTSRANYISPVLITKYIQPSTWTFILYTNLTGTDTSFTFDSSAYKTGIAGIVFTKPLESEIQLWRLNQGDYIGFELGAYIDIIGEAFYVISLLGAATTLYFRYRNFGIVTFFFAIFGGPTGLIWFFVPAWAAAVVSALVIIGTSFIVWRVLR